MANYRSLVPGGFFSSPNDPKRGTKECPASVWSNNPGAVNGANKNGNKVAWVQAMPGFVKTEVIGGGNPIAIFETPEQGVALWYELMVRYRRMGKVTLQDIINHYGGGQDYSPYVKFVANKTGFPASKVIDLNDDKILLPFFRAMIHYEAGRKSPLSDAQILYGFNLQRGGAKPVVTTPVKRSDLASQIVGAMEAQGFPVDKGDDVVNIVYIEGMNADGTPNANRRNAFDDLRVVLQVGKDGPKILGSWEATIETGDLYTFRPINKKGAARIAFGHHKGVWIRGLHRGYDALVQQGDKVAVYRDANKDFDRDGDALDVDFFGINQHHAFNAPRDNIGGHSAGCLVGRTVAGHEEFMELITEDRRYQDNSKFRFSTTVLKAADVLNAKPKLDPTIPIIVGTGGGVVAGAGAWADSNLFIMIGIAVVLAVLAGVAAWWFHKK